MSLEGESAPDFELQSTNGSTTSLEEVLESGPAVVSINRGHWCSFCAEQLATFDRVAEDLKFNDGLDFVPVVTSDLDDVVEMRDRFDYQFQLLADPDGEVAAQFSGTEETAHGTTGVSAVYVIDEDGEVRYEHVADDLTDRVYGNWIRYFVRDEFGEAFGSPF